MSKQTRQIKSYSDIQKEWQAIQVLDIKNQYKAMRGVAGDICDAYKAENIDSSKLQFYMNVLQKVNKIHDIPRCKVALSKITALWLELTGNADVKIVKKISGKINVDTAIIAMGDPSYFNALNNDGKYEERKILNVMNDGKVFVFNAHYDRPIQIRIVDSIEPVLSAKEYKCVSNSTETFIIQITTGVFSVTDWCLCDVKEAHLSVNLEPGNYKICVYHFYIRNKVDSLYIVLCKTDEEAKNAFITLPEFDS